MKSSNQKSLQGPSVFSSGPSPFTGQDLFAQAKAALIAQVPSQVTQNPPQMPMGQIATNLNQTNQANQQKSIFGTPTPAQPTNLGLLGTGMSPFGTNQSTFQTGGKRGKH